MIEIYHVLALVSALFSSVGNVLAKRAVKEGAQALQISFFANMLGPLLYLPLLIFNKETVNMAYILWPILMGITLFLGMYLSFLAIELGDVSVQTPILGTKTVFVAIFTIALGLSALKLTTIFAVILTVVAIFFVSYQKNHSKVTLKPVLIGLASVIFFVITDLILQENAKYFGRVPFVFCGLVVTALIFSVFMGFSKKSVRSISKQTFKWIIGAAVFNAVQSALVSFSLGFYGHATEFNVIQGSRGFWTVILVWAFGSFFGIHESQAGRKVMIFRLIGALCTIPAMILVVMN